ncbi:MAG: ABC transporter substrate-binding protein [Thermodesulfobacteriota bacterium]|nr:ABC transporter substrate-binding protein [Thermodesulfobacteriota bacterium]
MSPKKNIQILLVEDSTVTRKIEARLIKDLGFENIIQAVDGEQATEILTSDQQVDLIISDWNMNAISGLDLLKWVRAHATRSSVPFIMATGQGEKSQVAIATEAGVNSVVSKPFAPDDLMKRIEAAFSDDADQPQQNAKHVPVVDSDGKVQLTVGYIQITDHLVLGVAKHLIDSGAVTPLHFKLQVQCSQSWNQVADGLENNELDAALILAPMAVDLFGFDVPIKLVLLAHKNGSIMVRNKQSSGTGKELFTGKTFYLPHQLSVHHMITHIYMTELGLDPGVAGKIKGDLNLEIVPPVRMPELLSANANAGGFMVAEPLGTKAISSNSAELVLLSGEVWDDHPCCVNVFRQELIDEHPLAVQEFVNLMVQAGQLIADNQQKAAQIAVKFLDPKGVLNLNETVLQNVLTEPAGIRTHDLYPVVADLKAMHEYMISKMNIGSPIDFNTFVDLQFANKACPGKSATVKQKSNLSPGTFVSKVQQAHSGSDMSKLMLGKEGKYLFTSAANEEYGIGIMNVLEIVGRRELTILPDAPAYMRGVMSLRGDLIPVLDLNLWFGHPAIEMGDRIAIIVVETQIGTEKERLAIMVEGVTSIFDINAQDVEPAPDNMPSKFILAFAKIDSNAKVLLDVHQVILSATSAT